MALIACSECGKEVSDKASACPHCGNPLTAPVKVQVVPPKSKNVGCGTTIVVIFFALVVVSQCTERDRSVSAPTPGPSAVTQPTPELTVSQQLAALKARWDPNAPAGPSHIGLLGEAQGIASRHANTPEAAELAILIPLIEAKVKEHQANVDAEASVKKWHYNNDSDPMTGKTTNFAVLQSENTFSLDFPYQGVQHGRLAIRQHPQHGFDVMVSIEQGQVLCDSWDGCSVQVRFDEGEVRRWSANGTSDHSTETLFLSNERDFYNRMMRAKEVRVQIELYQAGNQTFVFDASGFDEAKFKATP